MRGKGNEELGMRNDICLITDCRTVGEVYHWSCPLSLRQLPRQGSRDRSVNLLRGAQHLETPLFLGSKSWGLENFFEFVRVKAASC